MTAYLDNAATTMVCPEAAAAALSVMTETYGNPSSSHTAGRAARAVLDRARAQVAGALGAKPAEVYFTSGGTESDNWALLSGAQSQRRRGSHIISSMAEHDAVRRTLDALESRGCTVTRLSPRPDGSVAAEDVLAALREDTVLVSLMLVNNETGGITDIADIARQIKKRCPNCLVHTDAVQAFMKVPFSAARLGADLISISGHKIHAPKGIGALFIRQGLRLSGFHLGGGQESGLRPGTENLPGIAAFGAAAEIAAAGMAENTRQMALLRADTADRLTRENPGLLILGGTAPHILSLSLPGYRSEVLMNFLEARGVYVSKSSACKKGARSHVLEACGLSAPIIDGALRVSLSRYTTREELDLLCDSLSQARQTLLH